MSRKFLQSKPEYVVSALSVYLVAITSLILYYLLDNEYHLFEESRFDSLTRQWQAVTLLLCLLGGLAGHQLTRWLLRYLVT